MGKTSTNQSKIEVRGTLSIRTLAMPADTNPNGDIFGGWLMSQN
jgi:acyl-CoA thioesterase YciA